MKHSSTSATLVAVAVLLLVAALLPMAAGAQSYTFTNIADTNGKIVGFNALAAPDISDDGTVAFHALFGDLAEGIFAGNGEALTTIADNTGDFKDLFGVSINASGSDVAFFASRDGGSEGIFRSRGGTLTTIADSNQRFFESVGARTSVNDTGVVSFRANTEAGQEGIFTGSGGVATTIIADSDLQFFLNSSTSINNTGTVAFMGQLDLNSAGIFAGSGGPTTTIADSSGPLNIPALLIPARPTINDAGTVAFMASFDTGGLGIFTGSGGAITTVIDTLGPFSELLNPTINNAGQIAFLARLDVGGDGIFLGPNPTADAVIQTGDTLFGSQVEHLRFGSGFNNSGDVAFYYGLANGVRGIAVAHAVPDPPIDGDFDDDGRYDCADVNALSHAIVTSGVVATFDLNGDGSLTVGDIDAWRAEAGEHNLGPGHVYTVGDANLDGTTDGADFVIWNVNKFHHTTKYCDANFNADIGADGADFVLWNANKFTSADSVEAVPEPVGLDVAMAFTLLLLALARARSTSRASIGYVGG